MIDQFSSLVAILIAISLATERLVTILKTSWPKTFGEERVDLNGVVDPVMDRNRRLLVQFFTFLFSYITCTFLTEGGADPTGDIKVGTGDGALRIPVYVMAILSMGGSAFWNNILGYTKAVKDIRITDNISTQNSAAGGINNWRSQRTSGDTTSILNKLNQQGQPQLSNGFKPRL